MGESSTTRSGIFIGNSTAATSTKSRGISLKTYNDTEEDDEDEEGGAKSVYATTDWGSSTKTVNWGEHEDADRLQFIVTNVQVVVYFISVWTYLVGSIVLVPGINDSVLSGILFLIGSMGFLCSDGAELWKEFQYPYPTIDIESDIEGSPKVRADRVGSGGVGNGDPAMIEQELPLYLRTSDRFIFKKRTRRDSTATKSQSQSHSKSNLSSSGSSKKHTYNGRNVRTNTRDILVPLSSTPSITDSPLPSPVVSGISDKETKPPSLQNPRDLAGTTTKTRVQSVWSLSNPLTFTKVMTCLSFLGSAMFVVGSVMFIYRHTVMYGVRISIVGSIFFTILSIIRVYEAGCHNNEAPFMVGERSNAITMMDTRQRKASVGGGAGSMGGTVTSVGPSVSQGGDDIEMKYNKYSPPNIANGSTTNLAAQDDNRPRKNTSGVVDEKRFQWENIRQDWLSVSVDVWSGIGSFLYVIGCVLYLPRYADCDSCVWTAWVSFVLASMAYIVSACAMGYTWYLHVQEEEFYLFFSSPSS